uniref:Uncharacterized protein n=1 Tax=Arundo donax TaxID=35708 RepID=A0A0A9A4W6_ARUDO
MPQGDQRVLGVPGDVDDPAIRRRGAFGEQGVGRVRRKETRRRAAAVVFQEP